MGELEYKCRKCGQVVSFGQYSSSRFCPRCGAFLSSSYRLKHWMFQFNPATYAWFSWIKERRETEQWLTSRYAKNIHEGDKVAVWASGEKAGVYALGEVATNPAKRHLDREQEKYWISKEDIFKFREKPSVTVKYSKVAIEKPLLEDMCIRDSVLSDMAVLKQPQGTNFKLTIMQWHRILELMNSNTNAEHTHINS